MKPSHLLRMTHRESPLTMGGWSSTGKSKDCTVSPIDGNYVSDVTCVVVSMCEKCGCIMIISSFLISLVFVEVCGYGLGVWWRWCSGSG